MHQIIGVNAELKEYIRTFTDLQIKDNTIVRVHSYLADKYPATRTRRIKARIKVSELLSVVCNGPCSVKFFPEKTNDAKTLRIAPWVNGMLLLMDRGFFKFDVFAKIGDYGGSFVTRIKHESRSGEKKLKKSLVLRLIPVSIEKIYEYLTYFTNIPEEKLVGRDVATLYATRWDLKTFFEKQRAKIY